MSDRFNTRAGQGPQTRRSIAVEPGVELFVTEVQGSAPGPTLGVIAGVHGDEVECIAALEDWLEDLEIDAGRILAIPVAHPAALAAGTRLGPDGIDLNRVAPGDAHAADATSRLAYALTRAFVDEADVVVTLHSWSRSGETVPYVEYPAAGEPEVQRRACELAHALGLPWAEPWEWPEGLVPAALCRAGVPAVEIEIGGLGRTTPAGHGVACAALDAVVAYLGLRAGAAPQPRSTTVDRSPITAAAAGRVRQLRPLGAQVASGEPVAEIRTPEGSVVATLPAAAAGTVAVHVTYGIVSAGEAVTVIFTPR